MDIVKRNNRKVNFNPQKLIQRLKQYESKEDLTKYIHKAVIDCQSFFYDGISTSEIDARLAQCVSQLSIFEPEMAFLGGFIVNTALDKDIAKQGFNYTDCKVLRPEFIEKYNSYKRPVLKTPKMSYFAAYTLREEFLLRNDKNKIIENSLDFYWRISVATSSSNDQAIEFYNELVGRGFACSNPISVNSGTTKGKLISCTTMSITENNKDGILSAISSAATHSANNSGLGIYIGDISSKHTSRTKGGKASGILRLVKTIIPFSSFFRQHEKRRGAFALYNDIWHRDILDFIPMKRQDLPQSLTDQDGFYGVCIPDLFYKRFEQKGDWSMFCPQEVKREYGFRLSDFVGVEFEEKYIQIENEAKISIHKVSASEVMTKLVDAMASSGVPYVFNRDRANENHQQKHLGVLKSQQLCVTGDTKIITRNGNVDISELDGKKIEAWNGNEFSETKFFKTGEGKGVIELNFSNGSTVKVTPNHKFFVKNRNSNHKEVEAKDLVIGDKLEDFSYPLIEGNLTLKNPYTQGFYSGDGNICIQNKGTFANLKLYGEKRRLLDKFSVRKKMIGGRAYTDEDFITYNKNDQNTISLGLSEDIITDKLFVPDESYTLQTRLKWLSGIIDSDGCLTGRKSKKYSIQISSNKLKFVRDIKNTVNLMGVNCKLSKTEIKSGSFKDKHGNDYNFNDNYRILINSKGVSKLKELGLVNYRCDISDFVEPCRSIDHKIKLISKNLVDGVFDVYCGTEPNIHRLVFNGVQASNCNEFSGIHNAEFEAQCDLGSIPLLSHVKNGKFDYESLSKSVKTLTRLLNNVIDINEWNTPKAERAGLEHRNIGIGMLGLADVFAELDCSYGSDKSRELNRNIQKTIYLSALEESNLIAKETGKGTKDTLVCREPQEWIPKELQESVKEYGVMNHLLCCNMPTSTTSKLLDVTQSFEVFDFPISYRKTVLGEFKQVNRFLVNDLKKLGFWNEEVAMELVGKNDIKLLSNVIPESIVEKYVDKYHHSNKVFLEMAADRQKFIDQGQSMNLYYDKPERSKISTALYYGWKLGLPSGSYYTTVLKPNEGSDLTSKVSTLKTKPTDSNFSCFGCD